MIGHKDFPSRSGGVEVMVGGLARSLVERGYDVTVYNRGLEKHHNVYDVIAGTFLVVGLGEEDFASLSPELAQKYEEEFHQPEAFLPLGRRLMVIPVPDESIRSDAEKAVSKPSVEHDR